jgi:hypothetical protein
MNPWLTYQASIAPSPSSGAEGAEHYFFARGGAVREQGASSDLAGMTVADVGEPTRASDYTSLQWTQIRTTAGFSNGSGADGLATTNGGVVTIVNEGSYTLKFSIPVTINGAISQTAGARVDVANSTGATVRHSHVAGCFLRTTGNGTGTLSGCTTFTTTAANDTVKVFLFNFLSGGSTFSLFAPSGGTAGDHCELSIHSFVID